MGGIIYQITTLPSKKLAYVGDDHKHWLQLHPVRRIDTSNIIWFINLETSLKQYAISYSNTELLLVIGRFRLVGLFAFLDKLRDFAAGYFFVLEE